MKGQTLDQAPRRIAGTRLPSWQMNLLLFGVLILITLAYFLWQSHIARKTFTAHVLEHTRLLAEVIEQQARSALLTQEVMDEIVGTYLGNTARFVSYLNSIESFSPRELTEFALEAGLAGIRVMRQNNPAVEGPPGWTGVTEQWCRTQAGKLAHLAPEHLYLFPWRAPTEEVCILVGLAGQRVESLQTRIGIDYLLAVLAKMPGMRYVRLEPESARPLGVFIQQTDQPQVAEARLAMDEQVLVVGSDPHFFLSRIHDIYREFAIFGGLLSIVGAGLSWLLYRHQQAFVRQVRAFDRALANEQQDAMLGRSAASIAHEIRNPLNAIGMGLQRLELEASGLEAEHRELLRVMHDAVRRTNGIIDHLKRFSQPLPIHAAPVALETLLFELLTLYEPLLQASGITVTTALTCLRPVAGSRELIQAAVDNLLKNAIEAQPKGGDIHIAWRQAGAAGELEIENGGCLLPVSELERIFEPYFTQKISGSGLGVPIAARIVRAHGGSIQAQCPTPGRIRILVRLPLLAEEIPCGGVRHH